MKEGRFVYSCALMDLSTRMYVGYAVSVKSEMDAHSKALEMIGRMRIDLKSVRLDMYYSGQSILEDSNENTRLFIIPKNNSRIRGKKGWRGINERPQIPEKEGQKRNVRVLQGAHPQSYASTWLGDFCPNVILFRWNYYE